MLTRCGSGLCAQEDGDDTVSSADEDEEAEPEEELDLGKQAPLLPPSILLWSQCPPPVHWPVDWFGSMLVTLALSHASRREENRGRFSKFASLCFFVFAGILAAEDVGVVLKATLQEHGRLIPRLQPSIRNYLLKAMAQ